VRDISYGVLGPQTTRVTYLAPDGRTVTEPTTGPDGAYLIVAPQGAYRPGQQAAAVSSSSSERCWDAVSLEHRTTREVPLPAVRCTWIFSALSWPSTTERNDRGPAAGWAEPDTPSVCARPSSA